MTWNGFTKASFNLLKEYQKDPDAPYDSQVYSSLIRDGFKEIKDAVFPVLKVEASC